jgi:hypothetical protein
MELFEQWEASVSDTSSFHRPYQTAFEGNYPYSTGGK